MEFRGWGTSLAWWANVDYSKTVRDELIKLLFSESGLGLNIVRYNLGGTNPNDNISVKSIPCIQNGPDEDINLENDRLQLSMLDDAIKNGVDTVEVFSNSPPWWMTVSGKPQGADKIATTNLKKTNIKEYCKFLVDSYDVLKKKYPVVSLEPFNEPSNPFWISKNEQEGCFFDFSTRNQVMRCIKEHDPSIFITACDSFSVGFELVWSLFAERRFIDRVNIHGYGMTWRGYKLYFDDLDILRNIFRKFTYKSLWVSEYGMGGSDDMTTAFSLAKHIFRDLYTLQPSAWIYWQVVENLSSNGWGLIQVPFVNPTEIKVLKQYWAMIHFTKRLRPGDIYSFVTKNILEIKKNNHQSAYIILGESHLTKSTELFIRSLVARDIELIDIRITDDTNNYIQIFYLPNRIHQECIISFTCK
jgi:hypothetical protein